LPDDPFPVETLAEPLPVPAEEVLGVAVGLAAAVLEVALGPRSK
jgi:hypothetical protein